MRVLFLVGRDPKHTRTGGGDQQAWAWARWLADRGDDVTFVSQREQGLEATEVVEGIRVLRLGRGVRLPWAAFRYYRRHSADFDLVYEDPIGSGRVPYVSPMYARVPVIAVWHQVSARLFAEIYGPWRARILSGVERVVAARYRKALFWAPSDESAEDVTRTFRLARAQVRVVNPTVDGRPPVVRSEPPAPVLVALGVMRPYKSFHHAIQALPQVLALEADARLVIAGRHHDAEYETSLQALARSLGVAEAVEFRFDITENEKEELLGTACALVLPSALEGFGIVALEANRAGTPVIASTGVPLAAVTDCFNGLRYRFGAVNDLADAAIRLLTDRELWTSLSKNSVDAAARFTPEAVAPQFEALIERATSGASGPTAEVGSVAQVLTQSTRRG
jgi:glycosyltransferase involved in cell wall biosynthesis